MPKDPVFNHEYEKFHRAIGLTDAEADEIDDFIKDKIMEFKEDTKSSKIIKAMFEEGFSSIELVYGSYTLGHAKAQSQCPLHGLKQLHELI